MTLLPEVFFIQVYPFFFKRLPREKKEGSDKAAIAGGLQLNTFQTDVGFLAVMAVQHFGETKEVPV